MDIGIIERAKKENWMICTYGLGYLGKRLYKDIPGMFELSAKFYCDGDDGKVDSVILPEMKGIYIKDLLEVRHPTIVFILVDDPYDMEIQEMLSANDNLYTVTLRELAQMNYIIKAFYGDAVFEKYKKLPDYSIKDA